MRMMLATGLGMLMVAWAGRAQAQVEFSADVTFGAPPEAPPEPSVEITFHPPEPPVEAAVPVDAPPLPDSATFHEGLSPYGEWLYVAGVGEVWRPYAQTVGAEFRPYSTGGHWVWTDVGWYWETDWAWGWAPFHYGRWFLDAGFGWVWMPGTVWGPAWVDWRFGGGYVGWAPLPPAGIRVAWGRGPHWCFVQTPYFTHVSVGLYAVPAARAREVFVVTTPVRERHWAGGRAQWGLGPPVRRVAAATHAEIRPVPVRPGYRPTPTAPAGSARPVPAYPAPARPAPSMPGVSRPSPVPTTPSRPGPTAFDHRGNPGRTPAFDRPAPSYQPMRPLPRPDPVYRPPSPRPAPVMSPRPVPRPQPTPQFHPQRFQPPPHAPPQRFQAPQVQPHLAPPGRKVHSGGGHHR